MRRARRALYTGMLTDTGQFRFNSTSRRCFLLAGELVARGANPAEAGYELYERETLGKAAIAAAVSWRRSRWNAADAFASAR